MEVRITVDETITIDDDDLRDCGFEDWIMSNISLDDVCFECEAV